MKKKMSVSEDHCISVRRVGGNEVCTYCDTKIYCNDLAFLLAERALNISFFSSPEHVIQFFHLFLDGFTKRFYSFF